MKIEPKNHLSFSKPNEHFNLVRGNSFSELAERRTEKQDTNERADQRDEGKPKCSRTAKRVVATGSLRIAEIIFETRCKG